MDVLRDGTFSFTVGNIELARGLRPSKRTVRNLKYLVECFGAVGLDSVLQVLDDIEDNRLAVSGTITDGFPYPQIFVFPKLIVICGETKIYEWVSSALVLKLTVAAGTTWSAVAFNNYVYMSNGKVAVIRRAEDQVWAPTTDLPTATAICDFNGQVLIGGPDEAWS
jgi:hypothetical protein